MVTLPRATPVTTPFSSTVATFGFRLFHSACFMVALAGVYFTRRLRVSPAGTFLSFAVISIFVTGSVTST